MIRSEDGEGAVGHTRLVECVEGNTKVMVCEGYGCKVSCTHDSLKPIWDSVALGSRERKLCRPLAVRNALECANEANTAN